MKTDIVLKDVDIPEGFEATGEYRAPKDAEWYLTYDNTACLMKGSYSDLDYCIILRKVEPLAIQACRKLADLRSSVNFIGDCKMLSACHLAEQAIDAYEKESCQ